MERHSDVSIRLPAQPGRDAPRPTAAKLRVRQVFPPDQRPAVLVQVGGEWRRGSLRKWSQDQDGGWWASVAWGPTPGTRFLGTFPGEHVREDDDSRSPRP